jgi:hypothetical protein
MFGPNSAIPIALLPWNLCIGVPTGRYQPAGALTYRTVDLASERCRCLSNEARYLGSGLDIRTRPLLPDKRQPGLTLFVLVLPLPRMRCIWELELRLAETLKVATPASFRRVSGTIRRATGIVRHGSRPRRRSAQLPAPRGAGASAAERRTGSPCTARQPPGASRSGGRSTDPSRP